MLPTLARKGMAACVHRVHTVAAQLQQLWLLDTSKSRVEVQSHVELLETAINMPQSDPRMLVLHNHQFKAYFQEAVHQYLQITTHVNPTTGFLGAQHTSTLVAAAFCD